MLVKEKFDASKNGIFQAISTIKPMPYEQFIQPSIFDMLYIHHSGKKTLSTLGEEETLSKIAETINELFRDKWTTLFNNMAIKLEIDVDYSETITTNKTINSDTNTVDNRTTVNKVSTFENSTLLDDEEKADNITTDVTVNSDDTITSNKKGVRNSPVVNLVQFKQFLKRDFMYDIIFSDVNEILTLSIYE